MAMTRKQKRQRMLEKRDSLMHGDGVYIFQNITGAELWLPRPTKAGRVRVGPREKFIGDSYYKSLKEVACLQEVQAPMQEKLITEVPPMVTQEGQVEFVQKQPAEKPMNEDKKKNEQQPQQDILLTENPLEGIRIMR